MSTQVPSSPPPPPPPKPASSQRLTRLAQACDFISLCHASLAIFGGTVITLSHFILGTSPQVLGPQWLLFCVFVTYYAWDSVALGMILPDYNWWMRASLILHHLSCAAILIGPLIYIEHFSHEAPIIMIGFILGEIPNPIRMSLKLFDVQNTEKWYLIHFIVFLVTRFLCLRYALDVILPECVLMSSKIGVIVLLLFSGGSVVYMSGHTWKKPEKSHQQ